MPLRNNIAALLVGALGSLAAHAQTAPPADLPTGAGPHATSQGAPGEQRYDEVGYALVEPVGGGDGAFAEHRDLPVNSFVEVTALDSGRTIAVMIAAKGPADGGHILGLSPAAARSLGIVGDAPAAIRVRLVEPSAPEQAALQSGHGGADRLDAPKQLLIALRKRLPVQAGASIAPTAEKPPVAPAPAAAGTTYPKPPIAQAPPTLPKPAAKPVAKAAVVPAKPVVKPLAPKPAPPPAPAPVVGTGSHYVQITALSNAARAKALAASLGGTVVPSGGLYRVRLGPYRDAHDAQIARDGIAKRGYADARVVSDH